MYMISLICMFPENHIQEISSLLILKNHLLRRNKRIQQLIMMEWIHGYLEQLFIILIDYHYEPILSVLHNQEIITIKDIEFMIIHYKASQLSKIAEMENG